MVKQQSLVLSLSLMAIQYCQAVCYSTHLTEDSEVISDASEEAGGEVLLYILFQTRKMLHDL